MKAILQFNLDNEDDAMAHARCIKSLDMALALWTFAGRVREIVDTSEDGKYIDADDVWEAWENVVTDRYNIRMDDLIK